MKTTRGQVKYKNPSQIELGEGSDERFMRPVSKTPRVYVRGVKPTEQAVFHDKRQLMDAKNLVA